MSQCQRTRRTLTSWKRRCLVAETHCDAAEIVHRCLFSAPLWSWGRSVWHIQEFKTKDFEDRYFFLIFVFNSPETQKFWLLSLVFCSLWCFSIFYPVWHLASPEFVSAFWTGLMKVCCPITPSCVPPSLLRLCLSWLCALVVLSPAVVPLEKSAVVDL